MVPYCGVRHHLAEWGWSSLRYVTSAEEDEVATNRRNAIAQQMWDSYQQVLLERAGDDEITDEFMEVDGYEDISRV